MAILTALPTQPLSAPHSIVLLAIIIRKYFPMILFLNPASIFLIFGATVKHRPTPILVDFKLCMQSKLSLSVTQFLSPKLGLGVHNFV